MATSPTAGPTGEGRTTTSLSLIVRLGLVVLLNAAAAWLVSGFFREGALPLAAAILVVAIVSTAVLLHSAFYPVRWMLIGIIMMMLFSIYPIIFTVFIAFTNYGDGHLLTQPQAIRQIERQFYLPETGNTYTWTAYRNDANEFVLWLQNPDIEGPGELAIVGAAIESVAPGDRGVGELDADGIPLTIEGYTRLNRLTVLQHLNTLDKITFGNEEEAVRVRNLDEAAQLRQRYVYDSDRDGMVDQQTGAIFVNKVGTFTDEATGQILRPGFRETVGLENFARFFSSPALRGPLVTIITWNFAFAFLSVFLTFSLGLFIAYIYNEPGFPGKKIIQSFLLIPYTIPSLITILIWRGLLNQDFGIINRMLGTFLEDTPNWTTNQWWARAAVLLVNLWLGYPYFMLITSGALQAIPTDLYQAAEVDGANGFQRFFKITLPLLLVAVGPLMIASFTFNFNNFNLIYLFIGGGPPIPNSPTPAGYTDILISYVYNLAFAGGRGVDYGFAAAITIIIFLIVAVITLMQFRFTKMWEEVSESV